MNITPQVYSEMSKRAEPKSKAAVNISCAFAVGGGICVIGQLIRSVFEYAGFSTENAGIWTSVILVALSAFFTDIPTVFFQPLVQDIPDIYHSDDPFIALPH